MALEEAHQLISTGTSVSSYWPSPWRILSTAEHATSQLFKKEAQSCVHILRYILLMGLFLKSISYLKYFL